MRLGKLRICIIDDEAAYFNPQMLKLAAEVGFTHIERHSIIDKELLRNLLKSPPDITILDIRGVAASDVAKNGFDIAKILYEETDSYIVITSAHKFHLYEYHKSYDYVIHDRLLTSVDFIQELKTITERYLNDKIRFYQKLGFRIGYRVIKASLMQNITN